MEKLKINGIIGEDEKEAFSFLSRQVDLSPSITKIPGFAMKLLKSCEEIEATISFNYKTRMFLIVLDEAKEEIKNLPDITKEEIPEPIYSENETLFPGDEDEDECI